MNRKLSLLLIFSAVILVILFLRKGQPANDPRGDSDVTADRPSSTQFELPLEKEDGE